MKRNLKSKLVIILLTLVTVITLVPMSAFTAFAAGSVRVDFCLTNGALENNVFFENNPNKYLIRFQNS